MEGDLVQASLDNETWHDTKISFKFFASLSDSQTVSQTPNPDIEIFENHIKSNSKLLLLEGQINFEGNYLKKPTLSARQMGGKSTKLASLEQLPSSAALSAIINKNIKLSSFASDPCKMYDSAFICPIATKGGYKRARLFASCSLSEATDLDQIQCSQNTSLNLGKQGEISNVAQIVIPEILNGMLIEIFDEIGVSLTAHAKATPDKSLSEQLYVTGDYNFIQKIPIPIKFALPIKENRITQLSMIAGKSEGIYVICDKNSTFCGFFEIRIPKDSLIDPKTGQIDPEKVIKNISIGEI